MKTLGRVLIILVMALLVVGGVSAIASAQTNTQTSIFAPDNGGGNPQRPLDGGGGGNRPGGDRPGGDRRGGIGRGGDVSGIVKNLFIFGLVTVGVAGLSQWNGRRKNSTKGNGKTSKGDNPKTAVDFSDDENPLKKEIPL